MDLHCPKCNSTQLFADKKGFSGKKAAAGAILTGGIGLLAGTLGSNKIIITCLACGHKFGPGENKTATQPVLKAVNVESSPSMDDEIANIITSNGLIVAIKEANARRGLGLEDAKLYVDKIVEDRKLTPARSNSGCAGVILIMIVASYFAFSCKPSKSDIVEAQKAAKDSIEKYESNIKLEEMSIRYRIQDSLKGRPGYDTDLINSAIEMETAISGFEGKIYKYNHEKFKYKDIYDSLEFELKKY